MDGIMEFISSLIEKVNISGIISGISALGGKQFLWIGVGFVAVLVYSLGIGRARALVSLLAVYAAYLLTILFPYSDWLYDRVGNQFGAYFESALFVAFYVAVFMALDSSSLRRRFSLSDSSLFQVFLFSLLQVGLMIAVVLSLLPSSAIPASLDPLLPYLASEKALFFWAVAALIAPPVFRGSWFD